PTLATWPFTLTRPSAMICSAARREHSPCSLMIFWIRSCAISLLLVRLPALNNVCLGSFGPGAAGLFSLLRLFGDESQQPVHQLGQHGQSPVQAVGGIGQLD